ncbi:MAG TPA: Sec-independent protein translocase protein TatB [Alphaproteobacteria bacterium]|nr:Sec-independent protein translocase protein TatB [Alphaproteobacteria bacterium]
MFDLSWTEILIVGAAALIFIGPRELPGTLRTIGRFVSKARSMAREFQGSVQEMVRESELDEIKKQVDKVTTGDYVRSIEKEIDPTGEINSALAPPPVSDLSAPNTMAPPGASPALAPPATPPRPTG